VLGYNQVIYSKFAEVICLFCHGLCCMRGTMCFISDKNKPGYIKFIRREYHSNLCFGFNKATGRCNSYLNKPKICRLWKCWVLNLISRLFKQPIWDGKY